jgi:hypothetical protein
VPHNVFANRTLIHTRIFIRLQMRQRFVGKAFCRRNTWSTHFSSHMSSCMKNIPADSGRLKAGRNGRTESNIRLFAGLPMIDASLSPLVGVVTGSGSASLTKKVAGRRLQGTLKIVSLQSKGGCHVHASWYQNPSRSGASPLWRLLNVGEGRLLLLNKFSKGGGCVPRGICE